MEIRLETPEDYKHIYDLNKAAFEPMPFSDGSEAIRVDQLRSGGDLTFSMVALDAGTVVGHIAFSPVFIENNDGGWYGLGPVCAQPERQRSGIGSALIHAGLDRLKAINAKGCVLIGDPAYYCRFGFVGDGRITYRELPKAYVQWLAFGSETPSGTLRYSPGLE